MWGVATPCLFIVWFRVGLQGTHDTPTPLCRRWTWCVSGCGGTWASGRSSRTSSSSASPRTPPQTRWRPPPRPSGPAEAGMGLTLPTGIKASNVLLATSTAAFCFEPTYVPRRGTPLPEIALVRALLGGVSLLASTQGMPVLRAMPCTEPVCVRALTHTHRSQYVAGILRMPVMFWHMTGIQVPSRYGLILSNNLNDQRQSY